VFDPPPLPEQCVVVARDVAGRIDIRVAGLKIFVYHHPIGHVDAAALSRLIVRDRDVVITVGAKRGVVIPPDRPIRERDIIQRIVRPIVRREKSLGYR
jgi:hypothetical protein